MKIEILNRVYKRGIFLFVFLFLILSAFVTDTNAQAWRGSRGRFNIGGRGWARSPRTTFYVAPRIGSRIRILPRGYLSLWVGGFPYYYYDGIYYQYYPDQGYYTVIEKPKGADEVKDLKFDQVRLNDGSTLEGVFKGATDSTITLSIDGKDHEINITDIIQINFAPTIKDSSQHK